MINVIIPELSIPRKEDAIRTCREKHCQPTQSHQSREEQCAVVGNRVEEKDTEEKFRGAVNLPNCSTFP